MKSAHINRSGIVPMTPQRRGRPARITAVVALIAFVLQVAACTSVRLEPAAEVAAHERNSRASGGVAITGYVTSEGVTRSLEAHVFLEADGSLRFVPEAEGRSGQEPQPAFTLGPNQVASLYVKRISPVKTTFAIAGGVVAVVGALALVAVLTKESCPFVYAFDGSGWVFDGEPYGGAISRGLARTDLSELKHLREVAGEYRVLLTNEVDETQHTDSLRLVVADHPPGTVAVADPAGVVRAFRSFAALRDARDQHGRDLSVWLRADDGLAWQDDLTLLSGGRPPDETRDALEIEFPRPPGVRHAWLVARAANTPWASHMLRRTLDLWGREVGDYYAALDTDPAFRGDVQTWHVREEVFLLAVETQGPGGWREQGRLMGGGPFIAERRALPLDLADQEGEVVRIRLRPPVGFWSFDSFALAWDEAEVRATVLAPVSARDGKGRDVARLLGADDGATLDFPVAGSNAVLTFRAPTRDPGSARTVFAATRGWYEIHLHGHGEPDRAALDALARQPGWIVGWSLDEFSDFRRSGILAGTLAAAAPSR